MTKKLKLIRQLIELLPEDDTTTYPRLDFNLVNGTYSLPISAENPDDGSIAASYKIGNIIYYISNTVGPKSLVLTDSKYKMSDVYPDTYKTMTTVPDPLNIGNITSLMSMFNGCNNLTAIPELNTSNVTNMNGMFLDCKKLITIPQLDTSNVVNMGAMFHGCTVLSTIPQLDTSSATKMDMMFHSCTSLPSTFPWPIDCSSITNANNIDSIFYNSSVTEVTLVNVNSSIKSQITSQYLKGDNTLTINFIEKKVLTDSKYKMSQVYSSTYSSMTTIHDILDTSNLTTMSYMFDECPIMTVPQMNTSNVTDMSYMFNWCFSLPSIPQLNTSNVTNMQAMFNNCYDLTTIPQLDTGKVTNMYAMFYSCNGLTTVPQLNTSNVTNMSYMFYDCNNLTTIPQLDTGKVTTMQDMFWGCTNLTTVPQMNTSNVISMNSMFYECNNLTTIPQMDTSKITDMYQMFYNCHSLPSVFPWVIDCSSIDDINNIWTMFSGSSVIEVTLANVNDSIKSQVTSELLKDDNTMTIHFI